MDLSSSFLGTNVTNKLKERISSHILTIGSDKFTRRDFAHVDCFNFLAAQNLSNILNKHLKVDNLSDVYNNVAPTELAIPRLGSFSLAVLGAAFEIKRLGGDNPLDNWLKKHKTEVVTFHTMKLHEAEDGKQEKKDRKRRKEQRRDKAHGLRMARFEKKNGTQG